MPLRVPVSVTGPSSSLGGLLGYCRDRRDGGNLIAQLFPNVKKAFPQAVFEFQIMTCVLYKFHPKGCICVPPPAVAYPAAWGTAN